MRVDRLLQFGHWLGNDRIVPYISGTSQAVEPWNPFPCKRKFLQSLLSHFLFKTPPLIVIYSKRAKYTFTSGSRVNPHPV